MLPAVTSAVWSISRTGPGSLSNKIRFILCSVFKAVVFESFCNWLKPGFVYSKTVTKARLELISCDFTGEVVPKDKLHPDVFKGWNRKFYKPCTRKAAIQRFNNQSMDAEKVCLLCAVQCR